ncbi:MAG: heparinase II/III family protein [Victivallaceae bacterium]|nr:heparinase II/III family protein [Victivallaceae bacterium]
MISRKLFLLTSIMLFSSALLAEKIIWQNDFEKTDGITGLTFGPPTKGISCYGTVFNLKYTKDDLNIVFKGLDKKEKFSGKKSLKLVINSTKGRYFYFKSLRLRKKILVEPNMYFSGYLNINIKNAPKILVKVCPVFETIRLKDKRKLTFEHRIGGYSPTSGLIAQSSPNWYSLKMELEPVLKAICKKEGFSLKDTYYVGWSIMINGDLKGKNLTLHVDDVKLYEKDTLSKEIKDSFYSQLWKGLWTEAAPCFKVKDGKLIASDGGKKLKGPILEKHLLKDYVASWEMTRLKDNGGSERALIIAYWPNTRIWLRPREFPVGRKCKMRLVANNGTIKVFQKFANDKSSKEKMIYEKDGIRAVGKFGFFHYNKFDYSYDNLTIIPLGNTNPPTPQNISINAKQNGTVFLSWGIADIYKDIFKYEIFRADNPEMSNRKRIGSTYKFKFLDKNPVAGKIQYYQIVSLNTKTKKKSGSIITKVQAGAAGKPGVVDELTACQRLDKGVSIFWNKPTGNCQKFKIYKKLDNTSKLFKEVSSSKDFIIDKEGGEETVYGVSVVNSAGEEGKIVWVKTSKPAPLKYAGEKIIKILGALDEKNWQPPKTKKVNPDLNSLRPHPRVLFTQEEIDAAKKKIKSNGWAKKCLAEIISYADKNLTENNIKKVDPFPLAMAYVLDGQEKYAKKAKEYLIYYADNYSKMPLKNNESRLASYQFNDSNWISRKFVPAYDLIYNCKILSDADKSHIENNLLRPAADEQMIDYRGKDSPFHQDYNFQAMRIDAVGQVGFCINEPKYINWAINGKYGFFSMLARCLSDDGLWWEKTVSYHITTAIPPLVKLAQAAYNNNLDLWHTPVPDKRLYLRDWLYPVDGNNGPKTLQGAFDSLFYLMFSDQSAPAFGDAVHMKWYGEMYYYLAQKHYPNDRYKWFNNRKVHRSGCLDDVMRLLYWDGKYYKGEPFRIGTGKFANNGIALNGSTLFPSTGYAVLRRDESNPDSTALAFTYGVWGGGHNHGDKLSFILYSNKTTPVYKMNYRQGPYAYQRATVSMNTVVADEISHWADDSFKNPNTGILDFFHADKSIQAVGAYTNRAYQDISFRRAMLLCPDNYLVDIFICRSPNEHQYDYVLHADSLWNKKDAKIRGKLGAGNGYQYIDVIDTKTSINYKTTWSFPADKPQNKLIFNMFGDGEKTQFLECLARAGDKNEKRAALIARRKAKNTVFISVMEIPGKGNQIQNIELLKIKQNKQKDYVVGLKITHKNAVDYLFYNETDSKHEYKNFKFKGRVFWVRYVDGKLTEKSFIKAEEFSDSKYNLNK